MARSQWTATSPDSSSSLESLSGMRSTFSMSTRRATVVRASHTTSTIAKAANAMTIVLAAHFFFTMPP